MIRLAAALICAACFITAALSGCEGKNAAAGEYSASSASASEPEDFQEGADLDKGEEEAQGGTKKGFYAIDCEPYYIKNSFASAEEKSSRFEIEGELRAGIVPHHLLASDKIASFFKTAAGYEYDTIVIIAPNHEGVGRLLTTCKADFKTPFGVAECDRDAVGDILKKTAAYSEENDGIVAGDHSICGIVPFVKYYLPNVRIVPIMLTRTDDIGKIEEIAGAICAVAETRKCLILGSIDFSHYLSHEEATKHDEETIELIKRSDVSRIKNLTNDNVDSPESLNTVLMFVKNFGLEGTLSARANAADYLDPPFPEGTTSYLIYCFCE